ncbi:hypothetical protein LJD47_29505 [Escherichia coli]|nr:hypothetical protein [Escherichia coli]
MKAALGLVLAATAAACSNAPAVVEQTQDGVAALVRTDIQESSDGMIVMDAVERHGFVRRQGSCLIVDFQGQEYSPVFRATATFRSALQFATVQPSASFELFGGPLAKVRRGFRGVLSRIYAGGCFSSTW